MASQPIVYTIQAPDAPQHTANLLKILQNLQTEGRIVLFSILITPQLLRQLELSTGLYDRSFHQLYGVPLNQ